jgi:U3 small nucleolar RNA-associated protein 18
MDLKMNTAVRSCTFLDELTMVTSGLDADVYIWDLRKTGRCVSKFRHEDGTCTSSLAAHRSPSSDRPGYSLAVGAESGVVSLFQVEAAVDASVPALSVVKSIMSLTTKITNICYHPSSEIMAIASDEVGNFALSRYQWHVLKCCLSFFHPLFLAQKNDQLKLVHLPSNSVFTNWPTERTPLRKVTSLAFSPGGTFFVVGNNKGHASLWRLKDYS